MNAEKLLLKVEEFANCLNIHDLDKAEKLDTTLIAFLGKNDRVVPRKDAPPYIQIMYSFNRAMLRLNNDEVEKAVLAMIDVAEIIRSYEMWDEIYFVLWMLAENKGLHDQFDQTLAYACDNLMMAVICQIKFPAMSLSLFWKTEKLFVEMGRQNTAEFVKGLRKLQYRLIAARYKNEDVIGTKLFEQKAGSLGNIEMRIPLKDETKCVVNKPDEPNISKEVLRGVFMGLNEHIPAYKEWGLYWKNFPDYIATKSLTVKKYGDKSIKDKDKLPNLLEVLEAVFYDEEKYALMYDKSPLGITIPFHENWSDLDKVVNNDGELLFLPRCRIKNWYYRGQTLYRENCQPSLHRGQDTNEVFIERLKLCEFSIIVNKHPMSWRFKSGLLTDTRSGNILHNKIHIDDAALAQHYGIKTEYMDLTTDKWAAAFFACCEYVKSEGLEKDTYKTYEDDKPGVFYIYQDKSPYVNGWRLNPIGIQPNARPVKQSAYVIKMGRGQNFGKKAFGIRFKHEHRCSSIVYKLFGESIDILPVEVIEKKAKAIESSNKFSKQALESARKRFYPGLKDVEFNNLLKCSSVKIADDPIVEFSEEELVEADKEFDLVDKFVRYNTSNKLFMSFDIDNC